MYDVTFYDGDTKFKVSLTAKQALERIRRYGNDHICNPPCPACQIADAVFAIQAERGQAPLSWPKWAREKVERYFDHPEEEAWGERSMGSLVIFDKDNTLVGGLVNRPANTPEEQHPLPNVVNVLAQLRRRGVKLAIASNQGGVAWGFITEKEAQALVKDAAAKVGGVDFWRCCCYDERAAAKNPDSPHARKSYRRKPKPGMLKEIIRAAGVSPANTVMVGDSNTDRQAAEAADCHFEWAKDFFGWEKG